MEDPNSKDELLDQRSITASKSSSSGSESSSTEEEERLRRLFQACDRDHDGLIDWFVQSV